MLGPTLLSWSSGKDSLWALRALRQAGADVQRLLTTCNSSNGRVAMHGVRRQLLAAQADALGVSLTCVALPHPCSNADYESKMRAALVNVRAAGIRDVAFGDLFLTDIRAYREDQLRDLGLRAHFPLWGRDTHELAREMVESGIRAVITCVDPARCPVELAGQEFDAALLERLPDAVDPCGENGEFHTFAYDGPGFARAIALQRGELVERDGFVFADLAPAAGATS
ncbi:MAG: adenine nucleotide alpha hydrolase [bacterium]|nr:adenine nucleotide alpha hydrolase [bacterium]